MSGFAIEGANMAIVQGASMDFFHGRSIKSRAIMFIPLLYNMMVILPSLLVFYDFALLFFLTKLKFVPVLLNLPDGLKCMRRKAVCPSSPLFLMYLTDMRTPLVKSIFIPTPLLPWELVAARASSSHVALHARSPSTSQNLNISYS